MHSVQNIVDALIQVSFGHSNGLGQIFGQGLGC
jgi:hypothetical protein